MRCRSPSFCTMADKYIIQKFGGTSLATAEQRKQVARCISGALKAGKRPIIVVSAPGRLGQPYATDSLLALVDQSQSPIAPRDRDLLISCGEIVSAVLIAHELQILGHKAMALTGAQAGIVTDNNHGNATVKHVCLDPLSTLLQYGITPVVAGFQGKADSGDVVTFSRGGGDTTAAVLGVAFDCEYIEIFTDVHGLFSADPRVVKTAKLIGEVNYTEAAELAAEGARIMHPHAVDIAQGRGVPICISSPGDASHGTIIHQINHHRPITGITAKSDIIAVTIPAAASSSQLFDALAQAQISADFITVTADSISFVTEASCGEALSTVLKNLKLDFTLRRDVAKVSLIGTGMTGIPGVMAAVVAVLQDAGIQLLLVTDSHTTISCLIDQKHRETAVHLLHQRFCE